jgi:hypothetical protein
MTRRDQFPAFLQRMLESPPDADEGVHDWLFCVARQLHWHLPAGEIFSLLKSRVANCGRFVPDREIISAVQNSLACAWQPGNQTKSICAAPKWPSVNQEQREAIIRDGAALVDLWENSPVRFDDNNAHTEASIDALFLGDPLLCCGLSDSDFDTRLRSEWRGELSALQLIVPSPMTARSGLTQDGQQSPHALSITGQRRFLVVEFDQGDVDDHAALLWHLALKAPLAMVVHSGSKSLHGWFFCAGQPEERLLQVMRYCVSLGADRATWSRSQFVRMPDGLRENGKRQVVYYFNPEVIK